MRSKRDCSPDKPQNRIPGAEYDYKPLKNKLKQLLPFDISISVPVKCRKNQNTSKEAFLHRKKISTMPLKT